MVAELLYHASLFLLHLQDRAHLQHRTRHEQDGEMNDLLQVGPHVPQGVGVSPVDLQMCPVDSPEFDQAVSLDDAEPLLGAPSWL